MQWKFIQAISINLQKGFNRNINAEMKYLVVVEDSIPVCQVIFVDTSQCFPIRCPGGGERLLLLVAVSQSCFRQRIPLFLGSACTQIVVSFGPFGLPTVIPEF